MSDPSAHGDPPTNSDVVCGYVGEPRWAQGNLDLALAELRDEVLSDSTSLGLNEYVVAGSDVDKLLTWVATTEPAKVGLPDPFEPNLAAGTAEV
ncbi:hypothetical protein Q5752_000754 [Cryptotrichosporon argae]